MAPLLLGVSENRVAARIAGLDPDLARQARHRLEVVGEHVGPCLQDGVDGAGVALEVAGEDLEHQLGRAALHRPDGGGPVGGAAVAQVVAIHTGDDSVAQVELGEHGRHPLGLLGVGRQRAAGGDVTEATRTGADAAEDHDGQRAAVPALPDVGAGGALAHGVQAELADPGRAGLCRPCRRASSCGSRGGAGAPGQQARRAAGRRGRAGVGIGCLRCSRVGWASFREESPRFSPACRTAAGGWGIAASRWSGGGDLPGVQAPDIIGETLASPRMHTVHDGRLPGIGSSVVVGVGAGLTPRAPPTSGGKT